MIHFKLYSRSYCHLCDDMLLALNSLMAQRTMYEVEVIDVDADDALVAKYDELVPVLTGTRHGASEPVQLCHYFLDENRVLDFLQSVC